MGGFSPRASRTRPINLGAIGSGAYYFKEYFGGEVIYVNHPDGANDGMSSISAGPIARLPMENFTLFAHGRWAARDWAARTAKPAATFEHGIPTPGVWR